MTPPTQSQAIVDHMADWSATLTTNAGVVLDVRPATPADEPLLEEMFAGVSPDDLRFRFLTGLSKVGRAQLEALAHVDHSRTENFLAFDRTDGRLAATAMLAVDVELNEAEVAISVRADRKHQGVGWSLLKHVARYANARGIKRLVSIENRANREAIELEREMGFAVRPYPGDPTLVMVEADLAELA